jgi:hypothetical protein
MPVVTRNAAHVPTAIPRAHTNAHLLTVSITCLLGFFSISALAQCVVTRIFTFERAVRTQLSLWMVSDAYATFSEQGNICCAKQQSSKAVRYFANFWQKSKNGEASSSPLLKSSSKLHTYEVWPIKSNLRRLKRGVAAWNQWRKANLIGSRSDLEVHNSVR